MRFKKRRNRVPKFKKTLLPILIIEKLLILIKKRGKWYFSHRIQIRICVFQLLILYICTDTLINANSDAVSLKFLNQIRASFYVFSFEYVFGTGLLEFMREFGDLILSVFEM